VAPHRCSSHPGVAAAWMTGNVTVTLPAGVSDVG